MKKTWRHEVIWNTAPGGQTANLIQEAIKTSGVNYTTGRQHWRMTFLKVSLTDIRWL